MASKFSHKIFLFMIMFLSVGALVACSAVTFVPTPTAIETNTFVATKIPVPSATNTVAPEPSPTLILLPTIVFPTEVISSKNIDQIEQLDVRELAGKPEGFFFLELGFYVQWSHSC